MVQDRHTKLLPFYSRFLGRYRVISDWQIQIRESPCRMYVIHVLYAYPLQMVKLKVTMTNLYMFHAELYPRSAGGLIWGNTRMTQRGPLSDRYRCTHASNDSHLLSFAQLSQCAARYAQY